MDSREHFFSDEHLIHDLESEKIFQILESGAWKTLDQKISSAETNNDRNAEPDLKNIEAGENACGVDAFADLQFENTVERILDVGGGKYEFCRDYMKSRNIELLVWDPYNKSKEHNTSIQNAVRAKKVEAATSIAVLNVIPEPEVRLAHITTLKEALTLHGIAYFKIWPGEGKLKGSYKPTVNSYGYPGFQANAYADRFRREVELVFGLDSIIHSPIPNLLMAKKISNESTSKAEIEIIQKLSMNDPWLVKRQSWLKNYISFFKGKDSYPYAREDRLYCIAKLKHF